MKLNPTVKNLNDTIQVALDEGAHQLVLVLCKDGTQYLKLEKK